MLIVPHRTVFTFKFFGKVVDAFEVTSVALVQERVYGAMELTDRTGSGSELK